MKFNSSTPPSVKKHIRKSILNSLKEEHEFDSNVLLKELVTYYKNILPRIIIKNYYKYFIKEQEILGNVVVHGKMVSLIKDKIFIKNDLSSAKNISIPKDMLEYAQDIEQKLRRKIRQNEIIDKQRFLKELPKYPISLAMIDNYLRKILKAYNNKNFIEQIEKGKLIYKVIKPYLPPEFIYTGQTFVLKDI